LNDPIMSSQPFEERNRLLWFGAHRVVGVGFRVPDDAIAVDHKTCGHRQLPGSIPITLLKIVLEGIDVEILQIAWQCKNQTECVGYLQAMIVQDRERELVLRRQVCGEAWQLRRQDRDICPKGPNLTIYCLQSIQLMPAVWSP